jgi:16S rRNA (cytosine967-C5)-methyltransferase
MAYTLVDQRRRRQKPRSPAGAEARAAAAIALHRVRDQGQSLTRLLQRPQASRGALDQALVQEMSYGALRHLPRLEAIAARLLDRPLKADDRDLESLILIGLYQLTAMNVPLHAAVSATVDASRIIGKQSKSALVNALLRRFLREREELLAEVDEEPGARWLLPDWLLTLIRKDWPLDWESIVAASNDRAPMSLRVNRTRIDPQRYGSELATAGIAAHPIVGCEAGLTLEQPRPTRELFGFDDGLVSVQDSGAQLAARLLDAMPGQRVLDACSAPGGKTAAILERAGNDLDLVAIDSDEARLDTVQATLMRLGLSGLVIPGDALTPQGDWTQRPFDRILLDVPCSATGVIRRHPDIKWLRRASDIPALCATQSRMLDAIWPLLAPGGRLLYATCSLLAAENHLQIAAFLQRQPQAREISLSSATSGSDADQLLRAPGQRPSSELPHGLQLLPTPGGSDGFFYALIEKVTS